MTRLFDLMARAWLALSSGLLMLLLMFSLSLTFAQASPGMFASVFRLQLAFGPEAFKAAEKAMGIDGVSIYLATMGLDFVYPLLYGVFFSSVFALLTRLRREKRYRSDYLLFVLPFLAMVADWVENSLHLYLFNGSERDAVVIFAASSAALVKWLGIAAVILAILYNIVLLLRGKQKLGS